jgi:hypothetical protein
MFTENGIEFEIRKGKNANVETLDGFSSHCKLRGMWVFTNIRCTECKYFDRKNINCLFKPVDEIIAEKRLKRFEKLKCHQLHNICPRCNGIIHGNSTGFTEEFCDGECGHKYRGTS